MDESTTQANNRRIARNTLMLYIRMLLVMAISLYTSRVLLNALGVVDYGLCNVVSGVVTLFNFISGALTTSTQRFLSFELGKNDTSKLKETFTSCLLIHFLAACIICFSIELIGCWILYYKLTIPINRFDAALWVFHFGVISLWFSIILIPYTACVVSHEKMNVFAIMSVASAVFKLIIVFLLATASYDRLKYYAILSLLVSIINFIVYVIYCKLHFPETHITKKLNKSYTKKISSFAGWNMIGQLAYILFSQGVDILLNVFFGPTVNAARAISSQVQGAIGQLSYNFQSALNPQITKAFAIGDSTRMFNLTFVSSKISFFLLLIVTIPFSTEADTILSFWLKNVPEYAVIFTQISIWITLLDGTANPLMTVAAATGEIKLYQTVVGGILLAILPLSYISLKNGFPPYSVFVIHFIFCTISFIARLFIVKKLTSLNIGSYFKSVLSRCVFVSALAFSSAVVAKHFLYTNSGFVCVIRILLVLFTTIILISTIGLNSNDRHFVSCIIKNRLNKINKK